MIEDFLKAMKEASIKKEAIAKRQKIYYQVNSEKTNERRRANRLKMKMNAKLTITQEAKV